MISNNFFYVFSSFNLSLLCICPFPFRSSSNCDSVRAIHQSSERREETEKIRQLENKRSKKALFYFIMALQIWTIMPVSLGIWARTRSMETLSFLTSLSSPSDDIAWLSTSLSDLNEWMSDLKRKLPKNEKTSQQQRQQQKHRAESKLRMRNFYIFSHFTLGLWE